jgi:predicted transcriptional regulator
LITPHEIKNLERAKWPFMTLHDVMRPLEEMRSISPADTLASGLELMSKNDLNQLPVVSNGHLEGVLSRAHVLRYLQTRAELQGLSMKTTRH